MQTFNIRTIEARSVDGDRPSWYDPNGCPDQAVINLPDGRQYVLDIQTISTLRAACPDTEKFIEVLDTYAGAKSMNSKMPRAGNFPQVTNPFPQLAMPRQQGYKFPAARLQQDPQVAAPSIQVDIFIPSSNFSFSTYFHEVLVTPPYIILVFNSSAVGFPKMFPQPGSSFVMDCSAADIHAVSVTALGLNFSHAGYEYCVLIVSEAAVNEDSEESKNPTESSEY